MRANKLVSVSIIVPTVASLMVAAPAASAKRVLRWWMGGNGIHQTWTTLEKRFEEANPGVDVLLLNGDMDKFYTMVTSGLMPDVWGPWSTPGIRADVNRNWIVELGPYIKRDGAKMDIDDFFPGVMREFRINGKQYSLPIFVSQDVFFYNVDMYNQAGLALPPIDSTDKSWNWDKMVANARKMTKTDGSGNVTVPGIDIYRGITWDPGYLHIWGANTYSDKAVRSSVPQEVDFTSKEAVTGFTKAWELVYKYKVAAVSNKGFESGKVGQLLDAGWVVCNFVNAKRFKWGETTLPWGVTNKGTMWPDGWRISRMGKDKELAWRFVKFLCSRESMLFMANDPKGWFQGTPFARKSVFNETLGKNISRVSGMNPSDVYKVQAQADETNVVKYHETICLHLDLANFLEPVMPLMWNNRISPAQTAARLQEVSGRKLPELFKRWLRNIAFTGRE